MIEATETPNAEQEQNARPMFSGVAPGYAYDRRGIPIYPGDTLKVFHFIGQRGKRHYMYKYVEAVTENRLRILHLSKNLSEGYTLPLGQHSDIEILQGDGGLPPGGSDFEDRPRLKA